MSHDPSAAPSFHSSGNLNADRRYEYARDLAREGDFAAAAGLYAQTLELVPHWAPCWFAYGECLEKTGQNALAIEAFRKVIELSPADPFGAGLHIYRLGGSGGEGGGTANHHAYVASLFDQYAPRFDTHLVQALHYRGPELMRGMLDAGAGTARKFERFVDLGCGTGLMALALKGRYAHAYGVDLSPQMVKKARQTGLYTRVFADEMVAFLDRAPKKTADLVLAADVLVYCGGLGAIFASVYEALMAGGWFGFSVQEFSGEGFQLGEDYRFAHSASYIRQCAANAGFEPVTLEAASTRQDRGVDVPGLLVLLKKPD